MLISGKYTSSKPTVTIDGDSSRRLCTYKVNVEEAGLYRLKAYSAFYSNKGTASFTLSVNGAQISKATHTPSGTVSGVTNCEGTDFETFNLAAGEQELTIRSSIAGDGAQLFTYYYTLERIGDYVINREISAEERTFEGENLFYLDAGLEISDSAMKISNTTARADVNVLNAGLCAVC